MENQHKHIKGYRDLTQQEIDAMNKVKSKAEEVGALINELEAIEGIDLRWLEQARVALQTGFMFANRSIARPTTFA